MASLADPSVFPFCNPDWDNTDFVASVVSSMRPLGTDNIDFPCNMTIGKAMSLPILCASIAIVFVIILYYKLMGRAKGPASEEDPIIVDNYQAPGSTDQEEYPENK